MNILAIDTSAISSSVAIVNEDKIIGEFFCNTALTHSQTLVPMIDSVLKNTNMTLKDIDAIAVCVGPGSFTGVRIGVAAAKGMAYALDIPCVPVSTLHSMAYNLLGRNCIVCAVMDARCSQVYNAMFSINGNKIERLCDDRALSIVELGNELATITQDIVFVGDGAEICMQNLSDRLGNISLAPKHIRYQNASCVGMTALHTDKSEYVTANQILPSYLRLPQAQRELKKKSL